MTLHPDSYSDREMRLIDERDRALARAEAEVPRLRQIASDAINMLEAKTDRSSRLVVSGALRERLG